MEYVCDRVWKWPSLTLEDPNTQSREFRHYVHGMLLKLITVVSLLTTFTSQEEEAEKLMV
jgi:hypothetical protein